MGGLSSITEPDGASGGCSLPDLSASPEDVHFVWTMSAAVHRLAQGIGPHHHGTNFAPSPFEVEMRRRLWWSIYLLDSQSSEFQAIGTQITEDGYDTKLPLNINDSDLSPESGQMPEERSGFTEMTFCLVRIEMIVHHRRSALNASESGDTQHNPRVLEERLCQVEQIHGRLQERYLQFCDTSVPVQCATATVIRLALARSWLIVHLSQGTAMAQMPPIEISPERDPKRDRLFSTAIEVVESACLLETDSRTMKWSWFFAGYPQWHAVMFVLSELCVRPQTAETDRAWAVVDKVVTRWIDRDFQKGGVTLKIVYYLMERAAAAHGRVWRGSESGIDDEPCPEGFLGNIDSFYQV